MRVVKLTVVGTTGAEFSQSIPVDDNYELPLVGMDEWIVIEGSDGSAAMVPPQRVVGITLSPVTPTEKKTHRGGRIN